MFLLLSIIVVAVAIGLLRGGTLTRLGDPPLSWWWLAVGGLVLQALPVAGRAAGTGVLLLSYVALGWFAWANRHRAGFWLVLAGLCMNMLVVALNGGMPVSADALLRAAGDDGVEAIRVLEDKGGAKHHLADGDLVLPLGDVIPVGSPFAVVLSPGDVLMYLGIVIFIVAEMGRRDSLPSTGPGSVG